MNTNFEILMSFFGLFRMGKTILYLFFALVTLCACYDSQNSPYNDDYGSDSLIDGILNSYRQDTSDSQKRTEEFDANNNDLTREVISMPGVSPKKVTIIPLL